MLRLYVAVTTLVLVWSTSMSFFALSAYTADAIWAIVGAAALLLFVGLGGALVPKARQAVPEVYKKAASWFMQFFGALITTELLIAALIAWIMGNRTHSHSNGYQVLGLLIFLALLGAGSALIATFVMFLYHRDLPLREQRRARALSLAGP